MRQLLRPIRAWVLAHAAVAVAAGVAALLLPALLAAAVDAALGAGSHGSGPLVLVIALVVALTAGEVAQELLEVRSTVGAATWLRRRMTGHLLRLGPPTHRRFGAGDLLSRFLAGNSEAAQTGPALVSVVYSLLTSAGGLIALALVDPIAAVVFLVATPLVGLLARGLARQTADSVMAYQVILGDLSDRFLIAAESARSIRAAGTVDTEISRILSPLPALRATGTRMWLLQRDTGWKLAILAPLVQIGVLAAAGHGVITGRISPGALVAITGYLPFAFGVFRQAAVFAQLGRVRGALRRTAEINDLEPPPSGREPLPPGPGTVTVTGVRVGADDRIVFDDVSLTVPAGAAVAIVGASGTGKSTLAAVLGGLHPVRAGRVLLDGCDLARVDPAALRSAVSCAFERPVLIGTSLGDALAYADEPVPAAAVARGLREARADGFVDRLPLGLDTPVADLRLSGGEMQRLGLARAFSRDARLLILDDATSSVDTVTEAEITTALRERSGTRILVAHRMSTAAWADLVVWLDAGRLVAVAPHAELIGRPEYRALFQHDATGAGFPVAAREEVAGR